MAIELIDSLSLWESAGVRVLKQRLCSSRMVNRTHRRLISPFMAIWAFIALVSVVDGYLVYRHRHQMLHFELNPIGRALIQWNDGQIWYLLAAKLFGTVAACAVLLVIHRLNVRLGLAITIGVACLQLLLLIFLVAT